jgi:ferredoxin
VYVETPASVARGCRRFAPYAGRTEPPIEGGIVAQAISRVHVDADKCQGHNRCYSVSPELFELDDLGMSSEVGTGIVPAELIGQARLAVDNCPEHTISLAEAETEAETEAGMEAETEAEL